MLHPAQSGPRKRVIIDTDAKNEADDQYAIVQAALTPSFDMRGMIAAQFGTTKYPETMLESRKELDLLHRLLGDRHSYPILNGASGALPDETTPAPSEGADLIVAEAMRTDTETPLYVAFFGPLTEMATALLTEPRIASHNVIVVWIGGGEYPDGGQEYNLSNDIAAANVVFASDLEVWQIPRSAYTLMGTSYAELVTRVSGRGELGDYLVDQLVEHNAKTQPLMEEYRSLGDSPAVGLMINSRAGQWSMRPAPRFNPDMTYTHDTGYRDIKVYHWIDPRFTHEDFFAKLDLWHQGRLTVN